MIKNKIKTLLTLILTLSIIAMGINTYAHSGRTDKYGGHKDNKNASGLGYYHYHCGGYPPHLHDNGVCPYSSNASSSTTKTTKPKTSTSTTSKSTKSRTTSTSSSKNAKSSSSTSTASKSTKSNTAPATSNSSNKTTKKVVKEETNVAVKDIEINEDIESMEIGESKNLTVTITPSNATDKKVTWKSSDEDIVKVSSAGKVTAEEAGTATITATSSNGKTNTIKIKVKEEPKQEEKEIAEPIIKNEENNKTIPASSSEVTNNTTETKEESSGGGGIIAILLGYLGYKKFRGR